MWFTPYYPRPVSKLSEVRLASRYYLCIWNTNVKMTISSSLYTIPLLVTLSHILEKLLKNDWRTSLLEDGKICHHQHWRQYQFWSIFRIKVYSITTSLYTKYILDCSLYEVVEKCNKDIWGGIERVICTRRGLKVWMS